MNRLHELARAPISWNALAMVVLLASPASAQTVYRCKAAKGVIYSQSPCGDDAERRDLKTTQPASSETATPGSHPFVDLGADASLILGTPASEVLAKFGDPAARYTIDDAEYWLYTHLGRDEGSVRQMVELRVVGGDTAQVNWLPEAVMRKSVMAARRFTGWKPSAGPRNKTIYANGEDLSGQTKAVLLGRFGEPDVKKVLNGIEVWEYRRVPTSADNPAWLTLYIEFSGDRVSQTMGN